MSLTNLVEVSLEDVEAEQETNTLQIIPWASVYAKHSGWGPGEVNQLYFPQKINLLR